MTALRPTGNVTTDRTQLEVVDPSEPGGLDRPHMVTVPQYLTTVDSKYLGTHPWEYPRHPYPQNEPAYQAGRGARKIWDNLTSTNLGSGAVSGLLGAGGGLAGSYLLDALGYRLFGKRPMGVGGRTLATLAGALLTTAGQQYYRNNAQSRAAQSQMPQPEMFKTSMAQNPAQLMQLRQQLASQVMSAGMPMDMKTQLLMAIENLAGPQLMALARVIAPIGGAMAGVAIAKFIFGDSILPKLLGGIMGGIMGGSALTPNYRRNAMGQQMI